MPTLPTLKLYYQGPSVRLLQINLIGLNYTFNGLQATGVFDLKTDEVVRDYQAEHRLKVDGIVGPVTWSVLLNDVIKIQNKLNSLGYIVGTADGIYGNRTKSAVIRFQRDNGLKIDGLVNPRTRQQMFNPTNNGNYDKRPSSTSLTALDPYVATLARRFLDLCRANNLEIKIIITFRSWDDQDALYAQGRTVPGPIVTDAQGGDSYHNWGLAFDCAPAINGVIQWNDTAAFTKMGRLGEQVGLEWGGHWTTFAIQIVDLPHFQYTFGLSTEQLLEGRRPPR